MYYIFLIDGYDAFPRIRDVIKCETLDAVHSSLNTLFNYLQVQWCDDESEDLFVQRVLDGVIMNLGDFDNVFARQFVELKWID